MDLGPEVELGGNVVWLQDAREGRALYYAHLERWAPASDGNVRIGDTLGFVGNTGNAATLFSLVSQYGYGNTAIVISY